MPWKKENPRTVVLPRLTEEQLRKELYALRHRVEADLYQPHLLKLLDGVIAHTEKVILDKEPLSDVVPKTPATLRKLKTYRTKEERLAYNLQLLKDKVTGVA